jgi:hypothetical protein
MTPREIAVRGYDLHIAAFEALAYYNLSNKSILREGTGFR